MRSRAVLWWRVLMIAGGFVFGLLADRRPFGETFLGHPIVVFAGIAGLGLLVLRVVLRRPVPEIVRGVDSAFTKFRRRVTNRFPRARSRGDAINGFARLIRQ